MRFDLRGLLERTPDRKSVPLLPLYEAVSNSVQATCQRLGDGNGTIHIHIHRDHSQEPLGMVGEDRQAYYPVKSIEIIDDGMGFDAVNFRSFDTVYSQLKIAIGGKGVGRLTWLKAFRTVEVESSFAEEGAMCHRTFKFDADHEGVYEAEMLPAPDVTFRTVVRLIDLKPEYASATAMPRRTDSLARDVIRHNLMFFVKGLAPNINIHDGPETLNLNQIYTDEFESEVGEDSAEINGQKFDIRFIKMNKSYEKRHKMHLCAVDRDVCSDYMDNFVPDLSKRLTDDDGREYVLLAYVTGPFLDKHVNDDRTDFILPAESGQFAISKGDLYRAAATKAAVHAGGALEKIRKDKEDFIQQYVSSEAPEFMYVLHDRYKEYLNAIPSDVSDKNALEQVIRVKNRIERDHRAKAKEILDPKIKSVTQLGEYQEKLRDFVEEENVIGKASLAKYVGHRRIILDLLRSQLRHRSGTNRHHLEKELHTIIHPMRTTSKDVSDIYNQNLWIIDERLTYHNFLVSDKPFRDMSIRPGDENDDRPDILALFDNPMAFSEDEVNYQSIVIIEFKRPGRDDYTIADNPVAQINKYIRHLQSGEAETADGRPINNRNLRFYVYIIADTFRSLQTVLEEYDFTPQLDGNGYYRFHDKYQAYVELLSYDQLLENAEKRNRVLFDLLHLPGK